MKNNFYYKFLLLMVLCGGQLFATTNRNHLCSKVNCSGKVNDAEVIVGGLYTPSGVNAGNECSTSGCDLESAHVIVYDDVKSLLNSTGTHAVNAKCNKSCTIPSGTLTIYKYLNENGKSAVCMTGSVKAELDKISSIISSTFSVDSDKIVDDLRKTVMDLTSGWQKEAGITIFGKKYIFFSAESFEESRSSIIASLSNIVSDNLKNYNDKLNSYTNTVNEKISEATNSILSLELNGTYNYKSIDRNNGKWGGVKTYGVTEIVSTIGLEFSIDVGASFVGSVEVPLKVESELNGKIEVDSTIHIFHGENEPTAYVNVRPDYKATLSGKMKSGSGLLNSFGIGSTYSFPEDKSIQVKLTADGKPY